MAPSAPPRADATSPTLDAKADLHEQNLNRIWLRVHADNPRAVRVYEKVGMAHEGCYRQGVYKKGVFVDVLIMSILKSEWDEKQGDL